MPRLVYVNVKWLCAEPERSKFETVKPRTLLVEQQHQGGDGAA
jgi:hypothetical protein